MIKKLVVLIGLMFFLAGCSQAGMPAGSWSFDEGKGDITIDAGNGRNNGKISGAEWVEQKQGFALEFDGKGDYVNCGNDASLDITNAITISAWIKPEGTGGYEIIVARGGWNGGFRIACNESGACLFYLFGVDNWVLPNNLELYDGNWHHVAFTYDKDGKRNNMVFYVDGRRKAQQTKTGSLNSFPTRPVKIGTCFNGTIDEVSIYNRALTADEISALSSAKPLRSSNQIKYWNPLKWGRNHWDPQGRMSLIKIPELDKTAIQMTSKSKAMHMFSAGWSVRKGDKCIIKALVKGHGKGALGVYTYRTQGGAGFAGQEFHAEDGWKEVVKEIEITSLHASSVAIVIAVKPASSIEFTDVTAEIIREITKN